MNYLKSKWLIAVLACINAAAFAHAADWLRFRGPNGSGVSADKTPPPTSWGEKENLKWKIKLPGPGSSCPIVVGDKIFVTCWTGYGTGQGGKQEDLERHLICVNKTTGKIIWDKAKKAVLPEDNFGGMFAEHGYASHTPVSDGKNVYAFYGKSGVVAYDLDGKELWTTSVGTGLDRRNWGSASSPILYKDLVIVTASAENQALVALDKETGKEKWKAKAGGFASTWGTPILVKVDEDRTDIVLGVPGEIWAFNPEDGKLRWYVTANAENSYCASVIEGDGVIYGIEGQRGSGIAVKKGGTGDVTKSHILWNERIQNRIVTPIYSDGKIYYISSKMVGCVDAKTGKEIYHERLTGGTSAASGGGRPGAGRGGRGGGGQDYGSPVAAGGYIYFFARNGDGYVVKMGKEFEQVAVNKVTKDREDFSASPAIVDGEIYLRSSAHLYCISGKEKE